MIPLRISTDSSIDGSTTSIFWNLLDKAWFWLKIPLNSLKVVEPIHLNVPFPSAGFNKLETSNVPPEAEPAPIMVCIS